MEYRFVVRFNSWHVSLVYVCYAEDEEVAIGMAKHWLRMEVKYPDRWYLDDIVKTDDSGNVIA